MLHLCYEDLRGMALQLLADYYGTKELPFRPLDPLDFAKNYMKLTVRYENLSYGRRVIFPLQNAPCFWMRASKRISSVGGETSPWPTSAPIRQYTS